MKQNNNTPLPKRLLDKFAPTFSEGGKLSWLHSFYEAMETFFYVPTDVTKKGSHVRDCNDMKRTMFMVIIALIPPFCLVCGTSVSRGSVAQTSRFWRTSGMVS